MTSLLVRHRVSNYTEWYRQLAAQKATRQADGELSERIFRNALDPSEVLVLYEWDDLDRARIFSLSDDFQDTVSFADPEAQPDIWFLQEPDLPSQSAAQASASSLAIPKEE